MVNKLIIEKTLNDILIKCSNNTIRNRLLKLTQEEKNKRLEGKINPFEVADYKSILSELDSEYKRLNRYIEENEYDFAIEDVQKRIEFFENKVFEYEKRIYRGYDLNKKLDNVPKVNINDFVQDDVIDETMGDVLSGNIIFGTLEQNQLDIQRNIDFEENEDAQDALFEYFRIDDVSLEMNSVLDHNYGRIGEWEESYWDYWGKPNPLMSESMRDYYTRKYKRRIKSIDSVMKESKGLLQPTVLYTGVSNSNIVDIHTRVGDKINMKSFISTSFQEGIAERYGAELGDNLPNLYVKFLAPTGTKGICANDRRINDREYFFEHEYLLDRGQSGTVVDIDYTTGCVTVLLE